MADNKLMIRTRQNRNPRNFANELFQKLTRLFSGPLVNYRKQTEKSLRQKSINKYASKFKSTSGQQFKRTQYNPFEQLNTSFMMNHQRAQRYADFSQMEFNPDLASVLDIYADEITYFSHLEPMLKIHCANEEIKEVLKVLYHDIMNINFNLFGWARTVCKYGDFFIYLDIDEEKGIKNVIGLPSEEVERIEGEDKDNPNYVQFQWNASQMTFENWQVAHFRILGQDKFVPYGTCHKYDTKITTCNGIKEIKDVITGDEVYSFDLETQRKIKTKVLDVVDSGEKECFRLSTRHNFLETSKEHQILCHSKEKGFHYKSTLEFKIGDLLVIDKKQNNEQIVKIDKTLPKITVGPKNWKNIDLIPDHINEEFAQLFGFLIGDGWLIKNAVEFALGVDNNQNDFYKNLLSKFTGSTLKCIKKGNSSLQFDSVVCYSSMFNKILTRMGFIQGSKNKRIPNWVFESNNEIKLAFLHGYMDADGYCWERKIKNVNYKEYRIDSANEQLVKDFKYLIQSLGLRSGNIRKISRKEKFIKDKYIKPSISYAFYYRYSELKQSKYCDNPYRCSNEYILEPITKIETIGKHATYDIYVENKNHNFISNGIVTHNSVLDPARRIWKQLTLLEDAMMAYRIVRSPERKVFYIDVGNVAPEEVEQYVQKVMTSMKRSQVVDADSGHVDLRYNPMSIEEDYYIPVRGASSTKIESLPGGAYTGDIDDVKYLRDKLFAAVKVPMSYLSRGEQGSEDKTSLAQKDIRFARTIQRIQRCIISELEKVGMIHLYLLGFRDEDLLSFNLALNNPSKVADLQELETWRTKFDTASAAVEGYFSRRFIAEKFFGLSSEEFLRNQREMYYDKMLDAQFESIATAGEEGGGGLGGDLGSETTGGDSSATEEAPEEDDSMLLASPEKGGAEGGDFSALQEKEEPHLTPGSKGKEYTNVDDDKRDMAARKRKMKSLYSAEMGSSTRRNVFKGLEGLLEHKQPNYEEREEKVVSESNKVMHQIMEGLKNRKKK